MPRNYLQELSDYMDRPFQERNKPGGMESSMERSQASMAEKPHLVDKPWYYGSITRYVCDNLLNQHGHDGDFLIRDSETNVSTDPFLFCFIVCMVRSSHPAFISRRISKFKAVIC